MRLHRLELTAFGPFAGHQDVDFDELSDARLFLLAGPTGAGKSTVLDAVCFGLYGDVPGDRSSAKRLRSDHAESGVRPEVVLELSIGARRLRLTRSPSWERPKKRGSGTTTEPAHVVVQELVSRPGGGSSWVTHTNRLDEAGQLVSELVGLTMTQFTQVAMLPQGRFQAFLRARSEERHAVLQHLFRTQRFADVEHWLVEHRQRLGQRDRGHQEKVAAIASRLCEVSTEGLPDGWEVADLALPAASGELERWAHRLQTDAVAAVSVAAAARELTEGAVDLARTRLSGAQRLASLQQRRAEALEQQATLESVQAQAEAAAARLAQARRAAPVLPLVRVAEAARAAEAAAEETVTTAVSRATALLATAADGAAPAAPPVGERSLAELEELTRAAEALAHAAEALAPQESERRRWTGLIAGADTELEALALERVGLDQAVATLPDRLAAARGHLDDVLARSAALDAVEVALAEASTRLEAAASVGRLEALLGDATRRLAELRDAAADAREHWQTLREQRITGMAAELATALAAGHDCPVCGSLEHPSPAQHVSAPVTREAENDAQRSWTDAEFARDAAAEVVAAHTTNLAAAREAAAGLGVAEAERAHREAAAARSDAQAATARVPAARSAVEELDREQAETVARLATVAERTAAAEAARGEARRSLDAVDSQLRETFGAQAGQPLPELARSHRALAEALAQACTALDEQRRLREARAEAVARAAAAAVEAGFEDLPRAAAAGLRVSEVEALETALRERDGELAAVATTLAEPDVVRAGAEPMPDLVALRAQLTTAEQGDDAAVAQRERAQHRAQRLVELVADLRAALAAWGPHQAELATARALAALAEGKGPDNPFRMRLSAYVLASRLGQVVAAANERLTRMSDQRYTLEQAAERGVGEARGGLSLRVRDAWTGDLRDPATLSGGETFVVSLALALGLSDVVTGEAGGAEIGTLFVDEGFGTLDPDTLDHVMDTLDELRDGGRVVGLVSHVPELATRIPVQLRVVKSRAGSTVSVQHARG